jgi:hypothetical protein
MTMMATDQFLGEGDLHNSSWSSLIVMFNHKSDGLWIVIDARVALVQAFGAPVLSQKDNTPLVTMVLS